MNRRSILAGVIVAIAFAASGCFQASLTCPDKVSTASYNGLNILAPTPISVSCTAPNDSTTVAGVPVEDGPTASVSGIDISGLLKMAGPFLAAQQLQATTIREQTAAMVQMNQNLSQQNQVLMQRLATPAGK